MFATRQRRWFSITKVHSPCQFVKVWLFVWHILCQILFQFLTTVKWWVLPTVLTDNCGLFNFTSNRWKTLPFLCKNRLSTCTLQLGKNPCNNSMKESWSLLHCQLAIVTMATLVTNAETSKNSWVHTSYPRPLFQDSIRHIFQNYWSWKYSQCRICWWVETWLLNVNFGQFHHFRTFWVTS